MKPLTETQIGALSKGLAAEMTALALAWSGIANGEAQSGDYGDAACASGQATAYAHVAEDAEETVRRIADEMRNRPQRRRR